MALSQLLFIDNNIQFDIILIDINMTSKVRAQGSNLIRAFLFVYVYNIILLKADKMTIGSYK